MKQEQIHDALNYLDDDMIESVGALRNSPKRSRAWIKWCAMAACFTLIVSISIPLISRLTSKDPAEIENVLQYNNAYYSILDMENAEILQEYKLPSKIEKSMIGQYVTTVTTKDNKSGVLYEYSFEANNSQSAVFLYKEKDKDFTFALFANYLDAQAVEAKAMFAVFGISSFEDIAEIVVDGESISDKSLIEQFYNNMVQSEAMNEDAYQELVFQHKPEAEQQALATQLAEDSLSIKIVTMDGLVAKWISYHPTIKCIDWGTYHYKVADMPF